MASKGIWYEITRHKEGIIVGAIVGLIAAQYAIHKGADLDSIINAGKGVMDNIMNRSSAVEVAAWKLRTAFMFMGAAIGFVADWILDQFV